MKLSLVTPVFNGVRFLGETLESLRRQGDRRLEYICCDAESTDGTTDLLRQSRDIVTELVVERDRGMYDALSKGFKRASGEILGWINADDVLMPWCVASVLRWFEMCPESEWVTGIPAVINGRGELVWVSNVAPRYRRGWIRRRLYSDCGLGTIQQECTFFRRSLYDRVGGLDVAFRMAGDFDLWCRMAEYAPLEQMGTLLAAFRKHGGNLSADAGFYLKEARARRIPAGKLIGYTYSYLAFLMERFRQVPRLSDARAHE